MKIFLLILVCLSMQGITLADQNVQELNGISIIGNKELPKSLVIVPWKASLPGEGDFFLQRHINEYIQPVDKEVFRRKVDFYQQSKK
ncbi:MAG: hypothetical protein AB8C40_04500 [Gammaproteobacteria bacterium]